MNNQKLINELRVFIGQQEVLFNNNKEQEKFSEYIQGLHIGFLNSLRVTLRRAEGDESVKTKV